MKTFTKQIIKKIYMALLPAILKKPQVEFNYKQVGLRSGGNDYGAWMINVDGLNEDSVIYSGGIGTDTYFDEELIRDFNLNVYGFDPDPKAVRYTKSKIEKKQLPDKFHFHDFGLYSKNDEILFHADENPKFVCMTVLTEQFTKGEKIVAKVRDLKTIMNELGHNQIDVLKIDIEGAEYDVVQDMLENKYDIKQVLIEFHHRFKGSNIAQTYKALKTLNKLGFYTYYIGGYAEEISLIHESQL